MEKHPFISVIIPVYNGEKFLHGCLDALKSTAYSEYELIVVDDCSTDRSAEISRDKSARVLRMSRQSGPGAARNLAVEEARGEVLFFVDADVVVKPDTLERVAADFMEHPDIAAVFGSYDDEPAEKNFISQYKNLFHRFVHQQASTEAELFGRVVAPYVATSSWRSMVSMQNVIRDRLLKISNSAIQCADRDTEFCWISNYKPSTLSDGL